MYTTCVFCSSVLWDWDCASVPLLLGPAEDERGGQEVGGKTHGRLLERSTRGCGQPLQAAHRSDTSLCSFGIYIKIHKITDSEKKKKSFLFPFLQSHRVSQKLWRPTPGRASGLLPWHIDSWSPNSPGTKSTASAGNSSADNSVHSTFSHWRGHYSDDPPCNTGTLLRNVADVSH